MLYTLAGKKIEDAGESSMAQWGGDGVGADQLAGPARARRQCDHDMPTAKMAATLNRPSHEIAATFSIGNQPQLATSQKNAARNALARSRPSPPMERKVSRRQADDPSDQQDDADEDRRRTPLEPGALRPGVVRVAGGIVGGAGHEQREGEPRKETAEREPGTGNHLGDHTAPLRGAEARAMEERALRVSSQSSMDYTHTRWHADPA